MRQRFVAVQPAGKADFPLVREMAAAGAPIRVPAAMACRIMKLSRQPYHQWTTNPVSQRDWDDAHLIDAALDAMARAREVAIGSSPTGSPVTTSFQSSRDDARAVQAPFFEARSRAGPA